MTKTNRSPRCLPRGTLLLAIACCLASCAPQRSVEMPGHREEKPPSATPAPPAPAAPPPQRQPAQEVVIPPPAGRVGTLLRNANQAMQTGHFGRAELQLERALRLAPREPQLWHAMARLRFAQGNYAQAAQFCLKSNSLAGRHRAIRRQNWLLLEKAYMKMGQPEKAAQARRQADSQL